MASEKALALVLRVIDFSETSCVVTLFTREFGKLTGLAKGGRRLKGPFEAALDLLALVRLVFLRKSSDALDLLTEAKLERRFRGHGRDLSSYYAGYYVAELLIELTDDYDAHPALFDIAEQTLVELSRGGPAPLLILRFELVALDILGYSPVLEVCAECGSEVPLQGRVAFGPIQGGVLCARCRPGKTQVVSVNAGTLRVLAKLANRDNDTWRRLDFDAKTAAELRGLVSRYLNHLVGHQLKMHQYLGAPS
jgi:DNA repair protein RecO (recombination protein O)